MLTIFSIPKVFVSHTKIIQDNAIGSWNRLGSGCDIVLFGDDPGVADAAERHKTRHESFTLRNELGTPLVSDVFHRMAVLARHPIVAFVNSDIILLDDFLPAIDAVARCHEKFLIVASRFNCCIDHAFSFGKMVGRLNCDSGRDRRTACIPLPEATFLFFRVGYFLRSRRSRLDAATGTIG